MVAPRPLFSSVHHHSKVSKVWKRFSSCLNRPHRHQQLILFDDLDVNTSIEVGQADIFSEVCFNPIAAEPQARFVAPRN
jgi:hypothetical protein